MIHLDCQGCGKHLKVHEAQLGRALACPRCKTRIEVPASERPQPPPPPTPPPVSPRREVAQLDPEPPEIPEHLRPKAPMPVDKSSPKPVDISSPRPADGSPARSAVPPEQEAIVHRVIDSLIRAFSAGKLAFFGLGTIASVLSTFGLAIVLTLAFKPEAASAIVLFAASALALIGLLGVVAGGVAFMFRQERRGHPSGIAVGLQFCARRFGVLFVDTGAAVLVVLVLFVGLNLTIALLNSNPQMGSLVGAALFLPQLICNVLLLLGYLTCVLVPCIVALTDVGLFGALKRFFEYLGRHGRTLTIHFAATLYFGIQILLVILPLMLFAFTTTLGSNAPAAASFGSFLPSGGNDMFGDLSDGFGGASDGLGDDPFGDASPFSGQSFGGSSQQASNDKEEGAPWGGGLRWISMGIALFVPFCYFCVFWIGSFTRFSEDLENPHDPARDIKISVSVDQGQGVQAQEVTG